jgi:hypothetical protein
VRADLRRAARLPRRDERLVDTFLEDIQIGVQVDLSLEVWARAGEAFRAYAERRRKDRAGQSKRLLVNFVVGAHTLLMADQLLTLDANRYRTAYPELRLMPGDALREG